MIRHCSTHDSTLFDFWIDPVWLMIRPCSTHDSTLFDSWFDPVRPCSTHDSALFASWFDRVRLMIWPCSTLSTLFDPWFDPVWPMIRLCWLYCSFDRRKLRRQLDSVRPCRPNHESNTSAREKAKWHNLDLVESTHWETVVYLMLKLNKITIVCCQKIRYCKNFYYKIRQLTAAVFFFYNCPSNWGS